MSRRQRQRENRRNGRIEERLDTKNAFNAIDSTPWEAVNNMRNTQKAVS